MYVLWKWILWGFVIPLPFEDLSQLLHLYCSRFQYSLSTYNRNRYNHSNCCCLYGIKYHYVTFNKSYRIILHIIYNKTFFWLYCWLMDVCKVQCNDTTKIFQIDYCCTQRITVDGTTSSRTTNLGIRVTSSTTVFDNRDCLVESMSGNSDFLSEWPTSGTWWRS